MSMQWLVKLFSIVGTLTCSFLPATDVEVVASHQDMAVYESVFKEHVRHLNHLQNENPKGWITFSSVPGMGKTHLAKHLETQLGAIRLSSDEIRALLKQHHLNPEKRDQETHDREIDHYLEYCLARLDVISPNKLYIFDMSIDRTYSHIAALAEQKQIPVFVVQIQAPRDVVENRLKLREGANSEAYLRHLDKWYRDYNELARKRTPDYVFDNSQGIMTNQSVDQLAKAIETKLHLKESK